MFEIYALNLKYLRLFQSWMINALSQRVPQNNNLPAVLFMQIERSKFKIRPGNQINRIQHAEIVFQKSPVPGF